MTGNEAIASMRAGNKVTHRYFTKDEYIYMDGDLLKDESGNILNAQQFWADRHHSKFDQDWSHYVPEI